MQFVKGPDLRQRDPGRRNQPHAAQDAGRAARGDAGAPGDRRPACAIRCDEPFFVLATQNPIEMEGTYPLPEAQLDRFMFNVRDRLPAGGRRGRGRQADDLAAARRRSSRSSPARTCCASTRSCSACRSPRTWSATPCASPPPAGPGQAGIAGLRQRLGELGRRHARRAVPGARREGPRPARRPHPRHGRRHPRPRPPHAAAPHPRQLPRRGRGRDASSNVIDRLLETRARATGQVDSRHVDA